MRYILYIVLIVTTATIGIFFFWYFSAPPPTEAALVVNNRSLTLADLKDRYQRTSYGNEDREAFYESVILRELLIQEAQKAGIDREENFRRTVQEFFEQSLIKVFMDRMYQEFSISLSPEEIAANQSRMRNRFRLTLSRYPSLDAARQRHDGVVEKLSEAFLDLPAYLREKIMTLAPGNSTLPFAIGKEFIIVRLDAAEPLDEREQATISEAMLVKKITEEKRALMMDQWIETLRRDAQVTFLISKTIDLGGGQ